MTKRKPLLERLKTDNRGSSYVSLFIALMLIFMLTFTLGEYFRLLGVRDEAGRQIQRGINVAVEEAMRDTWRWDKTSVLDRNKVLTLFDQYMRWEVGLDSNYRLNSSITGEEIWRLEITNRVAVDSPSPHFRVEGNIVTRSVLSFLTDDVVIPFSIRSRNMRLD